MLTSASSLLLFTHLKMASFFTPFQEKKRERTTEKKQGRRRKGREKMYFNKKCYLYPYFLSTRGNEETNDRERGTQVII